MKAVDFSETIATSDLKASRNSHQIEYLRYVSIEGQGHFLTLAIGRVHKKFKPDFLRNYFADLNQICMKAFRYKKMRI